MNNNKSVRINWTGYMRQLVIAGAACLTGSMPFFAAATSPYTQVGTVNGYNQTLTYSIVATPDRKKAYVVSFGADSFDSEPINPDQSLAVIDLDSGAQIGYVQGIASLVPRAVDTVNVAISPDGKTAYADVLVWSRLGSGYDDHALVIINVAENRAVEVISDIPSSLTSAVFAIPSMEFSPDGEKVYVVYGGCSGIGVISVKDKKQTNYVNLMNPMTGCSVLPQQGYNVKFNPNPGLAKAYVANVDEGSVSVINTDTDEQTGFVQFDPPLSPHLSLPYGIAFSPDGKFAYITQAACGVIVVDAVQDKQISTVSFPSPCYNEPGDMSTFGIELSPDGKTAYAINLGKYHGDPFYIAVIDTTDPPKSTQIDTVKNFTAGGSTILLGPGGYHNDPPSTIVFSSDGNNAYIINPGTGTLPIVQVPGVPATVTGVSPPDGPQSGGTKVSITGKHLLGTSAVCFGSMSAQPASVTDAAVTVRSPTSDTLGPVNVVVKNGGGDGTKANGFAYYTAATTPPKSTGALKLDARAAFDDACNE